LSFLPEIEQRGTKFYTADGTEKDILSQLSENGCNTIRLEKPSAEYTVRFGLQVYTQGTLRHPA